MTARQNQSALVLLAIIGIGILIHQRGALDALGQGYNVLEATCVTENVCDDKCSMVVYKVSGEIKCFARKCDQGDIETLFCKHMEGAGTKCIVRGQQTTGECVGANCKTWVCNVYGHPFFGVHTCTSEQNCRCTVGGTPIPNPAKDKQIVAVECR